MELKNKIKIVTASSLFDGHDVSINIMRRIMQQMGVEVVHLGHNRSALEIVLTAIQEDVQGIALTSYQGGHIEFFKYIRDLLNENGYDYIKIFGGGGGTILPEEIKLLEAYGITKIYSPDEGRKLGLEGMIQEVIIACDFSLDKPFALDIACNLPVIYPLQKLAREITLIENQQFIPHTNFEKNNTIPIIGITGTGGAGKSTLIDEMVRRFVFHFPNKKLAILSIDPTQQKSGGALLGDRIRMNAIYQPSIYMRSFATRAANIAVNLQLEPIIQHCIAAEFDCIILESAGVGQTDMALIPYSNFNLYVMTPEYGAASQLEKINMLDYADWIVINKCDKTGAKDALMEVRKQYQRNHALWSAEPNTLPIIGTVSTQFNEPSLQVIFEKIGEWLHTNYNFPTLKKETIAFKSNFSATIIPNKRVRYLSEIADVIHTYNQTATAQTAIASQWYQVEGVLKNQVIDPMIRKVLEEKSNHLKAQLTLQNQALIIDWNKLKQQYQQTFLEYTMATERSIPVSLQFTTLSGLNLFKIYLPTYKDWGDILHWQLQENVPGKFPFTAGVFDLKRKEEDPTRMFAGEGTPERTNKRFHYLSIDQPAKRLSTAFDSVTLYGEDPSLRQDIYGKIGNSGVNIATLDDAKKLYSGFDLLDTLTSVSMTINGPAAIILAFYFNVAIDQQCEKYLVENNLQDEVKEAFQKKYQAYLKPFYNTTFTDNTMPVGNNGFGLMLLGLSGKEVLPENIYTPIKDSTLHKLRGTIQADIFKEDQAQNTCIFSTPFALKLMGDVQAYFIQQKIKNFYSVSISGYHIAEAGANPITQLAFTLANGFTYVEYYASRGMNIDDFAPNLSFFFSNGMDPEYSVIGRVARRVWSKAMKHKYHANERAQKLKYHIQTSGRSLHAQEIDFNDIRTTLQALYAIYDNCNSLHTNAYDEAITTPTEESVRRAMAIQLIINKELGTTQIENFIQGSFALETLTNLVEEAVLQEFERITERGGVMGAMERMYQRNRIQEQSMDYELQKQKGEIPIVGVNTFLNKMGSPTQIPEIVIRSSQAEKDFQIKAVENFRSINQKTAETALENLTKTMQNGGNLFETLMETVQHCSLGQITEKLYQLGGQYRRNM